MFKLTAWQFNSSYRQHQNLVKNVNTTKRKIKKRRRKNRKNLLIISGL